MFIAYFVIGVCALQQFRVEAALTIVLEDCVYDGLDPEYVDPETTGGHIVETDDGANAISTKLTLVKGLPDDTQIRLKIFGLSMGEYIVPTGLDIEMGLCEALNEPIILGPFFEVFGFKKDECPPGPGSYGQEEYQPPMENLPDEFPENKYLLIFDFKIKGKSIGTIKVYAEVLYSVNR